VNPDTTHPNGTVGTAFMHVPLLRTRDGRPTCALHVDDANARCPFLQTKHLGMTAVCAIASRGIRTDNDDGTGFLRPASDCPVHPQEEADEVQVLQTVAAPPSPLDPPVRLCCGERHAGVVCPDGKVMCGLCFGKFEREDLSVHDEW